MLLFILHQSSVAISMQDRAFSIPPQNPEQSTTTKCVILTDDKRVIWASTFFYLGLYQEFSVLFVMMILITAMIAAVLWSHSHQIKVQFSQLSLTSSCLHFGYDVPSAESPFVLQEM